MKQLVNAMLVLMAGAVFADTVPVTAPEEMRKIPFIYCSDLFHPAMDPDDHFDLAAVFRLKELDVKAVLLDGHIIRPNQDQLTGGGKVPLEQMMEICGYKVPYAIGLKRKLLDPKDKALDEDPRYLAGVDLIIKILRESPVPVIIKLSTGTDFAVVFNREPELVREKVAAVYMSAGHGASGHSNEYSASSPTPSRSQPTTPLRSYATSPNRNYRTGSGTCGRPRFWHTPLDAVSTSAEKGISFG